MSIPTNDQVWSSKSDCTEESCQVIHELELRVRELNCLFGISKLVERSEGDLDAIFQGTAEALPSSWDHAGMACARIVLDGQEYACGNVNESPYSLRSDIVIADSERGYIEVNYEFNGHDLEEKSFFREEK